MCIITVYGKPFEHSERLAVSFCWEVILEFLIHSIPVGEECRLGVFDDEFGGFTFSSRFFRQIGLCLFPCDKDAAFYRTEGDIHLVGNLLVFISRYIHAKRNTVFFV